MKTINLKGFGKLDGPYNVTSESPEGMSLKRVPEVLLAINNGKPLQLWRIKVWQKDEHGASKEHTKNGHWFALAPLWYDARALVCSHFGVPFCDVNVELYHGGETPGPIRGYVVCKDSLSGTRLLYATGDEGSEGLVRGKGLREWESVEREGGRKNSRLPR